MMRKSVSWKIILCIVCMTAFSLAGYLVFFNTADKTISALQQEIQKSISRTVEKQAFKVESTMLMMEKRTIDIAKAGESFRNIARGSDIVPTDQIKQYLIEFFKSFPEAIGGGIWYEPEQVDPAKRFYGPYAFWDKGDVVFTWDLSTPKYDYLNQDWYQLAIPSDWDRSKQRSKKAYWTAPYTDEAGTGALMVSIAATMYDPSKNLIGIATIDLGLEDMQKMVSDIKVSKTNKAFAIDVNSGKILAWPADKKMRMKDYTSLAWSSIVDQIKNYDVDKLFTAKFEEKGEKWSIFAIRTRTGSIIGTVVPDREIYQLVKSTSDTNTTTISIIVPLQILILVGIWLLLIKVLVRPLNNLSSYAKSISDGDLEANLNGSFKDELAVLADTTKSMVSNLKEMMSKAEAESETAKEQAEAANEAKILAEEATKKAESARKEGMLQAAHELEGIVSEISKASSSLSEKLEESSNGAEVQKERTTEAATAMDQMNASVLEVASNASQAAESAESARNEASKGSSLVQDVLGSINQVKDQTNEMVHGLNSLGTQAEDIGRIMSVITDIADQTNLLALNAAIEAARAGEAGRGFAVVADEVRKLAEKTMEATKEVDSAVSSIQNGTQQNISGINGVADVVNITSEQAENSGSTLESILQIVDSTADQVRSIATASEEQSAAAEEINKSTSEVNNIAADTSEAMNEADVAIKALTSLTEELNKLIESLKND